MTVQLPDPPLVLASASASRRALLQACGLKVRVEPADIDETAAKQAARAEGADAADVALRLADSKAAVVAQRYPDAVVIGADQILVCDGRWFDKPVDRAAAREQLRTLRGRSHELATAVVCRLGGQQVWCHVVAPRLTMRDFSDAFLEAYLAAEGEAVTTTVGSYRLEGLGSHLFEVIEGEHSAILGLPLMPLLGFLRDAGVVLS